LTIDKCERVGCNKGVAYATEILQISKKSNK